MGLAMPGYLAFSCGLGPRKIIYLLAPPFFFSVKILKVPNLIKLEKRGAVIRPTN